MLFETFGNRQNPAVLFFHAMGVTGASSEPVARCLQDRYFCILPTSTVYCAADLPMGANRSYQGRPFSCPSAFPLARRYCRNLGMYSSIAPSMASRVCRFMSDCSSVRSRGDP